MGLKTPYLCYFQILFATALLNFLPDSAIAKFQINSSIPFHFETTQVLVENKMELLRLLENSDVQLLLSKSSSKDLYKNMI